MRVAMKLMAAAFVLAAACSGDDPEAPNESEVWAVNSTFQPTERTVHTGSTVTFVNKDAVLHNITTSDVPTGATTFGGALTANGGTVTFTPTVAGTYKYYCSIHGSPDAGMHGILTVVVP